MSALAVFAAPAVIDKANNENNESAEPRYVR
jgi:hypothetical protein